MVANQPEAEDQLLATVGEGDGVIRTCVGHGGGGPVQPGLTGHVQAMPCVAGAGPHPSPMMTATVITKGTSDIWGFFIVYVPLTDIYDTLTIARYNIGASRHQVLNQGFPKCPPTAQ